MTEEQKEELKAAWFRQAEAGRGKRKFYDDRRKEQAEAYRSMPKNPYKRYTHDPDDNIRHPREADEPVH